MGGASLIALLAVLAAGPSPLTAGQIIISEFLAENDGAILDEDWEPSSFRSRKKDRRTAKASALRAHDRVSAIPESGWR